MRSNLQYLDEQLAFYRVHDTSERRDCARKATMCLIRHLAVYASPKLSQKLYRIANYLQRTT